MYWICHVFLCPCLSGSATRLDVTGRVAAMDGGMERLGYGFPALEDRDLHFVEPAGV
jgi:hypothetical protein